MINIKKIRNQYLDYFLECFLLLPAGQWGHLKLAPMLASSKFFQSIGNINTIKDNNGAIFPRKNIYNHSLFSTCSY
jgi:hypothetical protein